jgi:hypothetical protein
VIEQKFRVLFSLKEFEYFGGRNLADLDTESTVIKDSRHKFGSKLFVVSHSANLELLFMEENHLQFFPQDIQQLVRQRLRLSQYVSLPLQHPEYQRRELIKFHQEDKSKRALIESVIEHNYISKNGLDPR